MPVTSTSQAAAVSSGIVNQAFTPTASVKPSKILLCGTYDPSITTITDEVPVRVNSAAEVGATYGQGFMLHYMARFVFSASNGIETWVIPQAEAGGAAASTGDIDFTGSVPTENGTLYLYVGGELVTVTVLDADTADDIATNVIAAVNANTDLPVTALVNGVTTAQVDFTAKSKGPFGDEITLSFNWGFQEDFPAGVTSAVTAMSGGSGVPTLSDALDGLGTGDDQNADDFTHFQFGYFQDSTSITSNSTYNGVIGGFTGNYSKLVGRPWTTLMGDNVAGSAGLNALTTIGAAKKEIDRTNGFVPVPGSPNHPVAIDCVATGVIANIANGNPPEVYVKQLLPGIIPGAVGDRWTSSYTSRDSAVKNGVGTTIVKGNAVYLQNVVTFAHPDSVAAASNIFADQRDIAIVKNVLSADRQNWESSKWVGAFIVEDVTKVGDTAARVKARDVASVYDDIYALADAYERNGWIYNADFMKESAVVSIRALSNGFDIQYNIQISGKVLIISNTIYADANIS